MVKHHINKVHSSSYLEKGEINLWVKIISAQNFQSKKEVNNGMKIKT